MKASLSVLSLSKQYDSKLNVIIEKKKRLKRNPKIAQEKWDILKKATAYFAEKIQ